MYIGNWKNNHREGEGDYIVNGYLLYKGNWKYDIPNGEGILYDRDYNEICYGNWVNGVCQCDNQIFYWSDYVETDMTAKQNEFYGNTRMKEWLNELVNQSVREESRGETRGETHGETHGETRGEEKELEERKRLLKEREESLLDREREMMKKIEDFQNVIEKIKL